MTDNRTTELREKLNKLIIELDRLDNTLDSLSSDMTLGEYEQEREKLLDGFMQAIAAWNARAERTCENERGKCSVCGATMYDAPNYCPNCGARVIA